MTTDREQLKLAAKAAGMILWCDPEIDSDYWGDAQGKYICSSWNPLTDDGDALRLAVKLHLTIDRSEIEPAAYIYCDWQDSDVVVSEPHGNDPYAATRRAIVRAAVEIGRNMK